MRRELSSKARPAPPSASPLRCPLEAGSFGKGGRKGWQQRWNFAKMPQGDVSLPHANLAGAELVASSRNITGVATLDGPESAIAFER